jgi:hypothetical protein
VTSRADLGGSSLDAAIEPHAGTSGEHRLHLELHDQARVVQLRSDSAKVPVHGGCSGVRLPRVRRSASSP